MITAFFICLVLTAAAFVISALNFTRIFNEDDDGNFISVFKTHAIMIAIMGIMSMATVVTGVIALVQHFSA